MPNGANRGPTRTPEQRAQDALAAAETRHSRATTLRDKARDALNAAEKEFERAERLVTHARTHPDLPQPAAPAQAELPVAD